VPTDWRERAVSPERAVECVRPGDRVFVGSACATPRTLLGALEDRGHLAAGAQLVHFLTDGALASESYFQHRIFYVGTDERSLATAGRAEYVPVSLTEVPGLIRSGRLPVDVALAQLSPPDDDGMCSLGVSVDVTKEAVGAARVVVAEVNPHMPRTRGDSLVPVDRLDHIVAVDTPVIEYVHPAVGTVAERIARYVARIIEDGSTLQIGLGRVPNEMLRHLTTRRDLGIHSDVITEPLVELIERGVVTGIRKSDRPGKVVTSWAMGTRRLYDLIDGDPRFVFEPIDRVCDPEVLARQERMVSVTQAFAIDLTGQVCADVLEGTLYGGVSSQPDFHRGASRSRGGKAIVCLASTQPDGSSAIRPQLGGNEAVVIPRADVCWVVTEYGITYLFGKSLRERAVALVEIAHPDHREALLAEAILLGLVPEKTRMRSRTAYPSEEERRVALKNDAQVLLRPSRTADAPLVQDLFFRMRAEDVYTRFFQQLRSLTLEMAEHLCSVGYDQEMAFVATVGEDEDERVVGTASYFVDASTGLADVGYMIDSAWHGVGLGTALQARAIEYARAHGVRGFKADVLWENAPMLHVLKQAAAKVTMSPGAGCCEVMQLFDSPPTPVPPSPSEARRRGMV
jgi:acyl-CoA hydrolase/GNAT superfamily N-acetyltransferase